MQLNTPSRLRVLRSKWQMTIFFPSIHVSFHSSWRIFRPCGFACPQIVCALRRKRMMPSSRELAANIWLTNDDVNTSAHKPINQTSSYKLIEFTVDGWGVKIVNYIWHMRAAWQPEGRPVRGKFLCLFLRFGLRRNAKTRPWMAPW